MYVPSVNLLYAAVHVYKHLLYLRVQNACTNWGFSARINRLYVLAQVALYVDVNCNGNKKEDFELYLTLTKINIRVSQFIRQQKLIIKHTNTQTALKFIKLKTVL